MSNARLNVAIICAIVAAVFLGMWSAVHSQRQQAPVRTATPELEVIQSATKPTVAVQFTSTLSPAPANMNSSMKTRRDHAWEIVQSVWAPVQVQGGKVPTWMTWYDQEDVEQLYKELVSQQPNRTIRVQAAANAAALLKKHSVKDLQASFTSARLGKTLRQFTFPEFRALGGDTQPRTGAIYYSPAFVQHLLENATTIAKCDPKAFPTPSSNSRSLVRPNARQPNRPEGMSQTMGVPSVLSIDSVPANLRPADPNNIYALCMDHEMPSDAIMMKAAWEPVSIVPDKDDPKKRVEVVKGSKVFIDPMEGQEGQERLSAKLSVQPAGAWPNAFTSSYTDGYGGLYASLPYGLSGMSPPDLFTVTDERGQKWALLGMHIAAKTVRTWQWISLFTGPEGWNWNADAPKSLVREWRTPFENFGMCTVSDFNEGDAAPWSAYERARTDFQHVELQSLAVSIKGVARVMNGAQWCANPYIETNMSHGNCIGCHQGSTQSFLPGVIAPEQRFNISDFSFSFDTNRANFRKVRAAHAREVGQK
ncbi:MAG TPA: hypothetical protein VE863_15675 [Pyrinomonadaceae bacterium]|nr:hypothetical protein [Pyrinomonadaceae bacterium]